MKIEKTFTVQAPAGAVWAFLTDPHRVARALPGAAITEQIDPQTYAGTITVKVGPVSTSYRGKMHFERLDAASGTAEIVASGQDVRGKGGAQMRMTSHVAERAPGETEVSVESDVTITGLLAQMGRGMIDDVSNQMFDRFSGAMRTELAPPANAGQVPPSVAPAAQPAPTGTSASSIAADAAKSGDQSNPRTAAPSTASGGSGATAGAPPIEVVSFGGKVLARALGRTARRPGFWVALVLLAIVLYWVWLR